MGIFGIAVLFFAVTALPLWLMLSGKRKLPPRGEEATPVGYWIAGSLLFVAASAAVIVLIAGFLLPGLEIIPPNWLTQVRIWIPPGRGSRNPPALLKPDDIDMTILMSSIAIVVLCFGAFLIKEGFARRANSGRFERRKVRA